jgi:hypothetical protein
MPTRDFKPTHIYTGTHSEKKGMPCVIVDDIDGHFVTIQFEDRSNLYPEKTKVKPMAESLGITTKDLAEYQRNYKPDHYHSGGVDPWQFIEANLNPQQAIGFHLGNVLKYVARHEKKNGLEDLKKAQDDLKEAIRLYEKQQPETDS